MRALPLLAFAALAGVLPFTGAYGNAAGCHLYVTGEALSDDIFLLTPDSFFTYATGCDFDALVGKDATGFDVSAICASEGETDTLPETIRILDDGPAGYAVKFSDTDAFGPFAACPPISDDTGTSI